MQSLPLILFISLNTIVWLLTLLKQYRTEYFYFFVLLNVMDIVTLAGWMSFDFSSNVIMFFITTLILLSILPNIYKNAKRRHIYVEAALLITAVFHFFDLSHTTLWGIMILCVVIILIITRRIIVTSTYQGILNLMHLLLLFYYLTVVFKLFNTISGVDMGVFYFWFFQVMHLLTGLAFCFVNVNTKHFEIKLG